MEVKGEGKSESIYVDYRLESTTKLEAKLEDEYL